VCLCACLSVRDHMFGTTRPIFAKFSAHVTYGRGSVLLWRRSDTLCTSSFVDDVMFAHNQRSLDVAPPPAEAHRTRSLGLGYKLCAVIPVAGQRTHGTTFRALEVTSQVATRGRSLRSMTALFSGQFTLRAESCMSALIRRAVHGSILCDPIQPNPSAD